MTSITTNVRKFILYRLRIEALLKRVKMQNTLSWVQDHLCPKLPIKHIGKTQISLNALRKHTYVIYEPRCEKTGLQVSDQV